MVNQDITPSMILPRKVNLEMVAATPRVPDSAHPATLCPLLNNCTPVVDNVAERYPLESSTKSPLWAHCGNSTGVYSGNSTGVYSDALL